MNKNELIIKVLQTMLHHLYLKRSIIYRLKHGWEKSFFRYGLCSLNHNAVDSILPPFSIHDTIWEDYRIRSKNRSLARLVTMELIALESHSHNRKDKQGYWWKPGRTKNRIATIKGVLKGLEENTLNIKDLANGL